ncbi:MAG: hypothetical protein J3Q66DRAFT_63865 [Benniella sp.]|nr:MAG: hypothetical protein J3Q66DRAFT_63865 [Benniella sp.]
MNRNKKEQEHDTTMTPVTHPILYLSESISSSSSPLFAPSVVPLFFFALVPLSPPPPPLPQQHQQQQQQQQYNFTLHPSSPHPSPALSSRKPTPSPEQTLSICSHFHAYCSRSSPPPLPLGDPPSGTILLPPSLLPSQSVSPLHSSRATKLSRSLSRSLFLSQTPIVSYSSLPSPPPSPKTRHLPLDRTLVDGPPPNLAHYHDNGLSALVF